MKLLLSVSIVFASNFSTLMAKDLAPLEDEFITKMNDDSKEIAFNEQLKLVNLTKIMAHQQKSYEERISFLESELGKANQLILEKSKINDNLTDTLNDKFNSEIQALKKELAYKTKSMLELQRQVEKIKPNEDLKNLIKVNTELASELRKSQDQIAFFQLKQIEMARGENPEPKKSRAPASLPNDKK